MKQGEPQITTNILNAGAVRHVDASSESRF